MDQFSASDIFQVRELKELASAPGPAVSTFVVSQPDQASDSYMTRLWGLRNGDPFPLSSPQFSAASPVLSPSGDRVAFISKRKGGNEEAMLLAMDGGEASPLGTPAGRLHDLLQWNGERILAIEEVDWAEDGANDSDGSDCAPWVANFLPWKRDGGGALAGKRKRLIELASDGGEPTVLLGGDFDVSGASWSRDGKKLACLKTCSGRERHVTVLFIGDRDGSGMTEVQADLAAITSLAWSPDGHFIACAASRQEGDSLAKIWLYAVKSGDWRCPWPDVELEGGKLAWHPDGELLAAVSAGRGLFEVVVCDVVDGGVCRLHEDATQVKALSAHGRRLLVVRSSLDAGSTLHSMDWDGGFETEHGDFNGWLCNRPVPRLEKRSFMVPNGDGGEESVESWLLLPEDRSGPLPLLMDLHGGPQSIALLELQTHMYWMDLCARGWAIAMPNPVGSGSYGEDFARRLKGRWGELDLPQVEAIVRQLQDDGITDDRVACTGKSYGAYLSAWAISKSSMFRAAAVSAPVANIESHAGTSDSGYYVTPYAMEGEVPAVRDRLRKLSPLTYAHQVTVPTLFLQGEDDERCPLGQTEELFSAILRNTSAPVQMVVYPSGSHSLATSGRPSHRLDYHRRLADWVDRWVANPH